MPQDRSWERPEDPSNRESDCERRKQEDTVARASSTSGSSTREKSSAIGVESMCSIDQWNWMERRNGIVLGVDLFCEKVYWDETEWVER